MIHARLLGPVELTVNGGAPPSGLRWKKHLALLLYLGLSARRGRSREHLMGLLWPDKPEARASHSLVEALRHIRRAIGEEALVFDGVNDSQVRLADGVLTTDLQEFSAHVAASRWGDAARLVNGEFLEGLSVPDASGFEEWLATERAAWRRRSIEALERHAALALDRGELAMAEQVCRFALSLDPLAEAPHLLLLRALVLSGGRAAALEQHAEFAARFEQALGVPPSQELRELAQRIGAERTHPGGSAAGSAAETRRTPLVGRELELTALLEAWRACRTARRAALGIVEGEPGVGKSRLLEEIAVRCRLDGGTVTTVRAVEADLNDDLGALRCLARGATLEARGVAGAPTSALATLADRFPEWQERYPAAAGAGAGALGLSEALAEVFRAVLEEQPLVLAIDDVQWLDRSSLLALEAWLRDLGHLPFLVVLGAATQPARPELDALRARIPRDLAGAVVHLEPLTQDSLRELAHWALPHYGEHQLARLTRRLAIDSAGLPLLAVELLNAVTLGLDLARSEDVWPAPDRTYTQTLPGDLSDTVIGAIRVGFRRLSPAAQQVLVAVAALDERVPPQTIARATGLGSATLDGALDELEWNRWLVAEPRGYGFVARVARDVVGRDMTTAGQRRRFRDAVQGT